MKTMQLLGVVAIGLISISAMAGCSGDDPPAAPSGGTSSTGGSGAAGTGATGGGGSPAAGSSNMGMQLIGTAAYTILTSAEAPAGAAAPPTGTASCGTCHGANGQGVDNLAPEIRHTPTDYMKGVVRAGRKDHTGAATGMAAFTTTVISDAELDAFATWAAGLPKPTTPEGLYRSMCGNCHGPKMPTGGGSPIKIQGVASARVDMFVRNGGTGTDVNDRLKYMPKYDTTLLTEEELGKIKMFIGAM